MVCLQQGGAPRPMQRVTGKERTHTFTIKDRRKVVTTTKSVEHLTLNGRSMTSKTVPDRRTDGQMKNAPQRCVVKQFRNIKHTFEQLVQFPTKVSFINRSQN